MRNLTPLWTQFSENHPKSVENHPKPVEISRNRLRSKTGAKMKVWNIRDAFGQTGQVRLTQEGRLEIKNNRQRLWRLIGYIDISLFTARDVKNALKATEGIAKVTRG